MRPDLLYNRFKNLENEKASKVSLMYDVSSFFIPEDAHLTGSKLVGLNAERQGELLDTTGSDLIEEVVAYVLGLHFNVDTRWFRLAHADVSADSDDAKALAKRAEKLYKLIAKTNYYAHTPILERDIIVHGHGVMVIEEDEEFFAKCYTKEASSTLLVQNEYGGVKEVYWESYYSYLELLERFPELEEQKFAESKHVTNSDKYRVITAYYPNKYPYMDKEDLEDPKAKGAKFVVQEILVNAPSDMEDVIKQYNSEGDVEDVFYDFKRKKYYKEDVIIPSRDEITRLTPYGSGIGKKALPKARILNKLKADMLRTSGLLADPPRYQTPEITEKTGKSRMKEGEVFTGDITSLEGRAGRLPVELLNVAGDLQSHLAIYQNEQEQLAAMLPVAGSIYKNARQSINEIQQRTQEQEKRLGPLRALYMREGIAKHVKRFYRLAERKGEFAEEAMKLSEGIDTNKLDFVFDTSLLGGYKQSKAVRAARALGAIANFLTIKPEAADKLDIDFIVELAFAGTDLQDALLPDAVVTQIRQAREQQAQAQQALQENEASARAASADSQLLESLIKSTSGEG